MTHASAPSSGPARAPAAAPWSEVWTLAGASALLALALGLYLNLRLNYVVGDAMSRVANASYVLFSRDPHLAAIGFIWNPLPSLLELPLVALRPLLPALVTRAVAGIVVSAAFQGIGVGAMDRLIGRLGIARPTRVALVVAYGLNPLVLLYGANGMSDIMLLATTVAAIDATVAFVREERLSALIAAALWLAIAFLVRYEAPAPALALALGIVLAEVRRARSPARIEAYVLTLLAPIVYSGFLWMFMNWLIMKNPLYFVTSQYGNAAQTATGAYATPALRAAHHSLVGTVVYALHLSLLFWPVLPLSALALILWLGDRRRRDHLLPVLFLGAVSVPVFESVFIFFGRSAGWDRFFLADIPGGILLAAWCLGQVGARWRRLGAILTVGVVLAGDVGTLVALHDPRIAVGDQGAVATILAGDRFHPFAGTAAVDAYVNAHPHAVILADSFDSWAIILRAARPRQFVITSDIDFASVLANPRGRVTWILVPEPTGLSTLDAVNRQYPHLWAGGVAWTRLVRSFPGPSHDRLYAVLADAP